MPHVIEIPDAEELNVPIVPISSSGLLAGAHHLGRQCDKVNKEFMLCKAEEKDPRKCLKEGREVTRCAVDFFNMVKGNCSESFTEYMTCLDTKNHQFKSCRKQQAKFDNCVKEKLNWERPELGQLSQVSIVKTDRPLPVREQRPKPEPVQLPEIPPAEELPPSTTGARFFFW